MDTNAKTSYPELTAEKSMNKQFIALSAGGLFLTLVIGGYFYTQDKAEKEVKRTFAEAGLLTTVQYSDVFHNPFSGKTVLNDVRLIGESFLEI